ncbi:MAG: helix-turn-helix domain-containing protein [Oscillospiraceae bacterium]|nr:helix-turn-helix domain-containing protein [Oscillospiraceae bacterium]
MLFQRLEDLRIDADKTQQQIADLLDCKREVYRRYEKGTYDIPLWALIKLADYYETSTDYILGLTNVKTPYPKK